jgi:lipopolysaccharide export system permease protein
MTILYRYITREYLKLFTLILFAITGIFLIIDIFERMRLFLSHHATFYHMLSYACVMFPIFIAQSIPVAVLLSALITFSNLSRYGEVLAMKANGISLYKTSIPVIIISVIICVVSFLLNEFVTPYSNDRSEYIKRVEVEKQKTFGTFKQSQIWYRGNNAVYNIKMFDPATKSLVGISIFYLDKTFSLHQRIDAQYAQWKNNQWLFNNLMMTTFQEGQFPSVEWLQEKIIVIPETPDDFTVIQKEPAMMGFTELRNYIRKIKAEGYDPTRYIVDLHGKVAFSLVSIILVIIGISFSLMRSERAGGIMLSIGVGMVVGFSYFIVFAFSMSLGRSGTIPPVLSAWIANIVLGLVSIVMYLRVKT